jgi:NADH:ubiquinone oxidoreductase subunit 5 (subunit L)/multisubunit Na+/H+ antiporter MnhA subunit
MATFAFWIGTFAALLTSFYSWRLMFLTFWGQPRWADSEHIQHAVHHDADEPAEHNPPHQEDAHQKGPHSVPSPSYTAGTGGYHPHESPASMLVPLGVLTLGAVAAGFLFSRAFLDRADFWQGSIFHNEALIHAMHGVPLPVKLAATIAMLIGWPLPGSPTSRTLRFRTRRRSSWARSTASSTTSGISTSYTVLSLSVPLSGSDASSGNVATSVSSTVSVPTEQPAGVMGQCRGQTTADRLSLQLCLVMLLGLVAQ